MTVFETHEVLDSTQERAAELARQGAAEGACVVAERQLLGRGRAGRRWSSPEGGLWMSMVLRPAQVEVTGGLTLMGALAVARVARRHGVEVELRWPNDVFVGEGKLAGVLAEGRLSGARIEHVILGIGLNVNVTEWDEPVPATSLQLQLGHPLDRSALALELRDELLTLNAVHKRAGLAGYLPEFLGFFHMAGRRVELETAQGLVRGTVAGLAPSGALRLEDGATFYSVERLRLVDDEEHHAQEQHEARES